MAGWLRLARLHFVLLAIFTVGRFLMFKVPYDKGHHVFSILTLTILSCVFHGAFYRRFHGFSLGKAALFAMLLGFSSQAVILLATALSYALGMDTYFTAPRALNQPAAVGFAQAMLIRVGGLVFNTLTSSVMGAIGWVMGAALPGGERAR